jgi:hypothetical protein
VPARLSTSPTATSFVGATSGLGSRISSAWRWDLAAWPFADYVFGCDYDVMSNTTKARQFGFHDVVDTEEMFLRHFAKLRADKVIP